MDNTFLTSAKPAIQNITTLYFSSVLLDEDGLLPDDDLLHALHACVLEHMLEQLSATKDVEPGKRFQDVTVAASGVVVSFFCSHVGRVTEGFDTMGAVDRWIGVMSDTLSGTFRNSRQNYSPDDTTLLDPAACEVYAIVRKDLGISFDKYGKEDVGKRVGAIYEAIRGGKFGGLGG